MELEVEEGAATEAQVVVKAMRGVAVVAAETLLAAVAVPVATRAGRTGASRRTALTEGPPRANLAARQGHHRCCGP